MCDDLLEGNALACLSSNVIGPGSPDERRMVLCERGAIWSQEDSANSDVWE